MIDIAIISVPGVARNLPQAAPALLKASVNQAGFTCTTVDLNLKFYQQVTETNEHDSLQSYFSTGINTQMQPLAVELIKVWAQDIIKLNPKFVGISVFTYQNRVATQLLCEELRKISNVKIVLGGQGLSDGGIEGKSKFARELQEKNIIDYWIRSEGEVSLIELLKGNIDYPGINSDTFKQIDDLDAIPFPDYSDYDLDLYEIKALPVTGSRGCVRSCSFCDIHEHWKYRFRTGAKMAEEILYLSQKHDVQYFTFSDSLINGSLKEFKNFTRILADYNETADKKISWSSQFIVRSPGQVNEQYWQDIAKSGGKHLSIGVETGSDQVRLHMNKKFTNADLDYTMQMLDKYNITCQFLILIGYPTETDQDFQDTLDMFTKYQSMAQRIITNVAIGGTLGILPGTPLHYQAKEFNIELDKYENNWIAWDNPELTLEKRLQRREILKDHVEKLNYRLSRDGSEHMIKLLEERKEMFDSRIKLKKMIRLKTLN